MNIYKFHNGEILSFQVVKENSQFYWLSGGMQAFGYKSRVGKREAFKIPAEAVLDALNNRRRLKSVLEDDLEIINKEINILLTLNEN